MVLSNNAYGTRGRSIIPTVLLCAASATIISLLSVALVREYQEAKKGAEAFAKEGTARLMKVKHTWTRHGSSDSIYFDTDGNPDTFEYYGCGPKAENAKEGQVMSGAEFMKGNPQIHFYKSEVR